MGREDWAFSDSKPRAGGSKGIWCTRVVSVALVRAGLEDWMDDRRFEAGLEDDAEMARAIWMCFGRRGVKVSMPMSGSRER